MADEYRPQTWDDYIGQNKLKERLAIHIAGAITRYEPLDNVLLVGPPGCGKTTIASLIANEMCTTFISFIMPIKPNVFSRLVQSYEGVVLLDEIHRLPKRQQEDLLPLIEDGYLQLENGARIQSSNITFIGATTEPQDVIAPLYDRFAIKPAFDEYTDDEMAEIVIGMADKCGIEMPYELAKQLGRATGGIPRNAKAIVKMARDLETDNVSEILAKCRLTPDGLTEMHVRYLNILNECGGTVGVELIGAHLGLPKAVLIDLERLLVKRGMIEYTKRGRSLLPNGYKAMGKKITFF